MDNNNEVKSCEAEFNETPKITKIDLKKDGEPENDHCNSGRSSNSKNSKIRNKNKKANQTKKIFSIESPSCGKLCSDSTPNTLHTEELKDFIIEDRKKISIIKIEEGFWSSFMKLTKFMIAKVIIPISFYCIIYLMQIPLQILVNDYCFRYPLCECKDDFHFFLSVVSEFLKFGLISIVFAYYSSMFLVFNFYDSKKAKYGYIITIIIMYTAIFSYIYKDRKNLKVRDLRINISMIFSLVSFLYILILAFLHKDINKSFFKRVFIVYFFDIVALSDNFYVKPYSKSILTALKEIYNNQFALNIFKVLLLIYNIFYATIANMFFKLYYEKTLEIEKTTSLNHLIIIWIKVVFSNVYTVKFLNILTMELDELSAYLTLIIYLFNLIGIYFGVDYLSLMKSPLKKYFNWLDRKKKSEFNTTFSKTKNGTILEMNFIILFRLGCFSIFSYFIYPSEENIYRDCTFAEIPSSFKIVSFNFAIIFLLHIILVLLSSVYMGKKKKIIFNFEIVNFSFVENLMIFNVCLNLVDYSLQYYKSLNEIKIFNN